MSKELFFIGAPVQFKTGVYIYPPTLKEVITNQGYGNYLRVLTYSQEEIEDELMTETCYDINNVVTKESF